MTLCHFLTSYCDPEIIISVADSPSLEDANLTFEGSAAELLQGHTNVSKLLQGMGVVRVDVNQNAIMDILVEPLSEYEDRVSNKIIEKYIEDKDKLTDYYGCPSIIDRHISNDR